jgi:hypothetical protein
MVHSPCDLMVLVGLFPPACMVISMSPMVCVCHSSDVRVVSRENLVEIDELVAKDIIPEGVWQFGTFWVHGERVLGCLDIEEIICLEFQCLESKGISDLAFSCPLFQPYWPSSALHLDLPSSSLSPSVA